MERNDSLRSITAVAQVGGYLQYYQRRGVPRQLDTMVMAEE